MGLLSRLFAGANDREVARLRKIVAAINALEPQMQALSDAQLAGCTADFRLRVQNGESLDALLPEAFAVVREAGVRTLGQRAFDTQMLGGIVLHQGRIAELKTGEGKTLAATLPAYLNALSGNGVHIVTVNDYLAKYHSEWMGNLYAYLGMSVGLIAHGKDSAARRQAYAADITYGTNNEFGFDYLRDNMVTRQENMVQRMLNFAIVDEVDSILIDEARTPLIISGEGDKPTEMYARVDRFVQRLTADDYTPDEKMHAVTLSEQGVERAEAYFHVDNLSDPQHSELNHHINQALKARVLMHRDKDYVVQDGQVIIVDEFTGRLMIGRRYSQGLHQAIEAKENVKVERESRTLATITFQNYFRMYKKISGMTGTAKTEEEEFRGIYGLDVVQVPTNRPMIRTDHNDVVYSTQKGKFDAVVERVHALHSTGQPVLVGTVSVEKSEHLSALLKRRGVPHQVLNAKHHEREAEIVAQAGKVGMVTIATNMAGRGTDIMLGGNADFLARTQMRAEGVDEHLIMEAVGHAPTQDEDILAARARYQALFDQHQKSVREQHKKVAGLGGLFIIGTERHESRRIDNQLRGRAGRQGDPGASEFYVSLEDDLMRLFGSERIQGLVQGIGMTEDMPLQYGMLSKQIEGAQKRVESRNYQTRKNVLEFDDVMNQQREIIYSQRRAVLRGEDVGDMIRDMLSALIDRYMDIYLPGNDNVVWDTAALLAQLEQICLPKGAVTIRDEDLFDLAKTDIKDMLMQAGRQAYAAIEQRVAEAGLDMPEIERAVVLRAVDRRWMDHIDAMDELRNGVYLRAYGQKDPLVEYKIEGFEMFDEMIAGIQEDALTLLYHINIQSAPQREETPAIKTHEVRPGADAPRLKAEPVRSEKKVGRNDPCPCGSGKKYKNCCGRDA